MGLAISTALAQRTRDSGNGADSIPNNGAKLAGSILYDTKVMDYPKKGQKRDGE